LDETVQQRTRLAGLEGNLGGHSLRSGFVTEASHQEVSLAAIMAMAEHRMVSIVRGYSYAACASAHPATRLFEDIKIRYDASV
jgi:hypothetical protein